MAVRVVIVAAAVLLSSCTGVRSVQLHPPMTPPPGMVWGYGVEKLSARNAGAGRQAAYLKAIDDLLTRGPVVVSKAIQDNTSVVNVRTASRRMESRFRLRASRVLQPSFMETGTEDGFVWVLLGTTEEDMQRSWQQFLQWRTEKISQSEALFNEARGPERLSLLRASFAMLEEAGAEDDPGMLYYRVKTAIDQELSRIAELEQLQKDFRKWTEGGQLLAAESALDHALQKGLDQTKYRQCKTEIIDRRNQAAQLIAAGDGLLQDQQYKKALERYQHAQKLDRDNPQLPAKLALAEQYHRQARSQSGLTAGVIIPAATRALGEYFAYKQEEERRKRAEAEKAAEEARRENEEADRKSRRRRGAEPSP